MRGYSLKKTDLSDGSVTGTLLRFALPMIAGRVLGPDALAAVGLL